MILRALLTGLTSLVWVFGTAAIARLDRPDEPQPAVELPYHVTTTPLPPAVVHQGLGEP